jgi:UDP:flavonoid glycosyltransferase YjiC (YdhE family)
MRALDGEPLHFFHDLFDVEENILATLPELDHYGGRQNVQYDGPILDADDGDAPQWPERSGKRVFVYLRPGSPIFQSLTAFLRKANQSTVWFSPGLQVQKAAELASGSLTFVRHALNMKAVAESADIAVCAGGHGTTSSLFLARKRMLLAPGNVEQLLLARRIAETGMGTLLPLHLRSDAFAWHVAEAIDAEKSYSAKSAVITPVAAQDALTCNTVLASIERRLSIWSDTHPMTFECV